MNNNWNALIERAKNNDQQAFNELYQNSYDAVYRTVKSMVRDEDAVLDIVQDSFIKAFGNLSALDKPESFVPWLKRIAVNKAKDWFKKRHDVTFSQLSDEDGNEPEFVDERTEYIPEAVIDRSETARLIDDILNTLSDEQRITIGMYYYQDMSVAEIAQELNISENTVKSRLNYGRKKIKLSVEELAKKGTKLYGLAPVPFLIWLFRNQIANPTTGAAPAATFGSVMSQVAAQGTATTAGGTAAAAGKAGILSTLGGKIAAAAVAVAVVGGGIGVGVYLMTNNQSEDIPAVVITDTDTSQESTAPPESTAEEETDSTFLYENPGASSPEELLTAYLEEILIPEKGIYNIEQTAYSLRIDFIDRIDNTYDPVTGELKQTRTHIGFGRDGYEEALAGYYAALENRDISGMQCTDIYDYDGDGEAELLAVYGDSDDIYLELFDTQDSEVISVGKLSFEELDLKYETRYIGRFKKDDGTGSIVVIDSRRASDTDMDSTYYQISSQMELISVMDLHPGSLYDCTETFFDGRPERTFKAEIDSDALRTDVSYYDEFEDHGSDEKTFCVFDDYWIGINDFLCNYYKG